MITMIYNYYSSGAGAVREIWEMDKMKMRDDFVQDQQDNCKFPCGMQCMYYTDM